MSRGRRDVLRYLTILLSSTSTMTTLSVRSLLTKSSPAFVASPPEDRAVRNATVSPSVRSLSMCMLSSPSIQFGKASRDLPMAPSWGLRLQGLIGNRGRRGRIQRDSGLRRGSRLLTDAPEKGQRRLHNAADILAPGIMRQVHA